MNSVADVEKPSKVREASRGIAREEPRSCHVADVRRHRAGGKVDLEVGFAGERIGLEVAIGRAVP